MDDMLDEDVIIKRVTEKQRLKMDYLEKAHSSYNIYIEDLESNLLINKQIISELCGQKTEISKKTKGIIEKLNEENKRLTTKVKKLMLDKKDIEAKLLIQTQIINEFRIKEEENVKEFKSTIVELKDQLSKKEYAIQCLEKKYAEAQRIIFHYLKDSPEVAALLTQMKMEAPNVGITNVVEQNNILKKKVTELTGELNKLKHSGFLTARNTRNEMDTEYLLKNFEGKFALKQDIKLLEYANTLDKANKELQKRNEELRKELEEVKENYECLIRNYQNSDIGKINELDDKSLSKISNIHIESSPENHIDNSQELPDIFDIEIKN